MPTDAAADHAAIALPRSSRGNTLEMIDSVAGMISAPPAPITARTAISWSAVSTNSTQRLASPNSAVPAWSASLRPKRSPTTPNESSRPANTSRYESLIHWSCELSASSCSCSDGSATDRIVLSRPMITSASESTPSVFQRRS